MKNRFVQILTISIILTSLFNLTILAMAPMEIDSQAETNSQNLQELKDVLIVLKDGQTYISLQLAKQSLTLAEILKNQEELEINLREITSEIFGKITDILSIKVHKNYTDEQKSKLIKQYLKDLLNDNFENFKECLQKLKFLDCTDIIKIAIDIIHEIQQTDIEDPNKFIFILSEFTDYLNESDIQKLKTKLKKRKRDVASCDILSGNRNLINQDMEHLDLNETIEDYTKTLKEPLKIAPLDPKEQAQKNSKRRRLNAEALSNDHKIQTVGHLATDLNNQSEEIDLTNEDPETQQLLAIYDDIKRNTQPIFSLKHLSLVAFLKAAYLNNEVNIEPKDFLKLIKSLPPLAREKFEQEIKLLINKPISGDEKGSTYLHLAKTPSRVVNLLLLQADPSKIDVDGKTALVRMLERGNLEAAKVLIKSKFGKKLLLMKDSLGNNLIHYIAALNYPDLLDLINNIDSGTHLHYSSNSNNQNKDNPLMTAVKFGNKEIVSKLLSLDIYDLDQKNNQNNNVFSIAILYQNTDIFKMLIEKEFEDSVVTEDCTTLLILSAKYDCLEIIKTLLSKNISVNQRNHDSECALLMAASYGNIDIVKFLLTIEDIDVNLKNNWGNTALRLAVKHGKNEVVKLLLTHKDINVNVQNKDMESALGGATSRGNKEIVQLLLSRNDINVNLQGKAGYSALIIASKINFMENQKDIVQSLLMRTDIDVNLKNIDGDTALTWAAHKGKEETVNLLLSHKDIDVNLQTNEGYSALIIASKDGFKDIVQLLLTQKDIDVNLKNVHGDTALTWAAHTGKKEIVNLLLSHKGIDVNLQSKDGYSALILASRNGFKDIVQLLLTHADIDVNLQNTEGQTALTDATANEHREIINLLLSHKDINVNLQTKRGNSALTIASKYGLVDIAQELLMQKNIDINLKTTDGKTALDLAIENGHKSIVNMLLAVSAHHAFLNGQKDTGLQLLLQLLLNCENLNKFSTIIERSKKSSINDNDFADLVTVYLSAKEKENYKDLPMLDRMNIEAIIQGKENVKRILADYFFSSLNKK